MNRTLLALVVLAVCGNASRAQNPAVAVTGRVLDATGRPVRDAIVVVDPESLSMRARTSTDGRFRLDRVVPGEHTLQVARIGFRPQRLNVTVPATGLNVDIVLEAVVVTLDTVAVQVARTGIHGVVVTRGISLLPHEPRPLRGAVIEVLNHPYRATTGRDGTFRIDDIGEGAYSLLVRLDRYPTRMVAALVPPNGGLDMTIVLDSTIADWQRRDDMYMRDISRRLREARNPSAFVSAAELYGPGDVTLSEALRVAPSTLSRGMVVKDDVTCIYVNGLPRPGLTANEIYADDVHAVEAYGFGAGVGMPVPWLMGTFCGTGTRQGPYQPAMTGPRGGTSTTYSNTNYVSFLVVWTRRSR